MMPGGTDPLPEAAADEPSQTDSATRLTAAEEQTRATQTQRSASEERFQLLVDSVRDYAIFILDPAGYIASWNKGAERIKGYTAAEIIGQHFSRFYPPEDLAWDKPGHELRQAAVDGRLEDEGWRVRQDGSRFWANVVITALYDAAGRLRGFGKVTRDITDRRQTEEALRRLSLELEERVQERTAELEAANAQLRAAVQQREQFLATASHELRTPLTTTKLSLHLAVRELERTGHLQGMVGLSLRRLQRELGRLEELVADLLDAARIQQGHLELRPETVDLVELAQRVLERFEQAPERTPQHQVVLDASAPVVGVWDPSRVDQVLTNLVSNALKYSPAGGEVRVVVSVGAEQAEVRVRDHGIGIPAGQQAHLFQPFVRAEMPGQSISGVGLGLYIVKHLVAQHGGTVHLESEPGAGTTVTVCLPLQAPGADEPS